MIEKYPFFVYGTLIPGEVNDFFWGDCVGRWEAAVFRGGRLYDMGSFPMMIERGKGKVAGQVMYPYKGLADEEYELLVRRLDSLENYDPNDVENSPYYRVLRTVYLEDERPVKAWVYLGRPVYTKGRPVIPDGDWVGYSAGVRDHISVWWEEQGRGLLFGDGTHDSE